MSLEDLYRVLSNDTSVVIEESTPQGMMCVYVGNLRDCNPDYMSYNVVNVSLSEKGRKLIVEIFN